MKNIKEIITGVLILAFFGILFIRQTDNPNLDFRIIDSKINTNFLLDNKDKMIIIKCLINDGDTTIIKKFGDKQMDFSSKHINILLDKIDNFQVYVCVFLSNQNNDFVSNNYAPFPFFYLRFLC